MITDNFEVSRSTGNTSQVTGIRSYVQKTDDRKQITDSVICPLTSVF